LLCSGAFGWGYSEKVPTATGNEAGFALFIRGGRSWRAADAAQRNLFAAFYLLVAENYRGRVTIGQKPAQTHVGFYIYGSYRKKSQQTPNRNGFLHKDNILEADSVTAGMFCSVLLEDKLT
jgi:hypothetical protein